MTSQIIGFFIRENGKGPAWSSASHRLAAAARRRGPAPAATTGGWFRFAGRAARSGATMRHDTLRGLVFWPARRRTGTRRPRQEPEMTGTPTLISRARQAATTRASDPRSGSQNRVRGPSSSGAHADSAKFDFLFWPRGCGCASRKGWSRTATWSGAEHFTVLAESPPSTDRLGLAGTILDRQRSTTRRPGRFASLDRLSPGWPDGTWSTPGSVHRGRERPARRRTKKELSTRGEKFLKGLGAVRLRAAARFPADSNQGSSSENRAAGRSRAAHVPRSTSPGGSACSRPPGHGR